MKRQRQPEPERQAQDNGLVASRTERKSSPDERDDDSQCGEIDMYLGPSLPEDMWYHIHSLMGMRDAGRAACVSRAFVSSWRCHPNLTFSSDTLGLNENACEKDELARDFYRKVDCILKRHSCIGVKKLKIQLDTEYSEKDSCYLNSWLQTVVKPGIEELILLLYSKEETYNFPYTLLSNGSGDSIRCLQLAGCSIHLEVTPAWFKSLTRIHLCFVRITEDELGCLLSHCFALERLEIRYCNWIVCVRVPCLLQRLSYLEVIEGERLEAVDNEAPNLSSFLFEGDPNVQLSLGDTLQMKSVEMAFPGAVLYSRTELPSIMPNLECINIHSNKEINTPMLCSKFLRLKTLNIAFSGARFSPAYDYLSLASFLSAAPSLETFNLHIRELYMEHVSILADPTDLRQMQAQHHHSLKSVTITGFCSAKSLVELVCHVLRSVTSLECLTLESSKSICSCSHPANKSGKCSPMPKEIFMEACRGVLAIRTYIEPKVPSTVKLHVLEPCSCHPVDPETWSLS